MNVVSRMISGFSNRAGFPHRVGTDVVAGDAEVTIQVSSARCKLAVKQLKVLRVAGVSAVDIQPRIYDTASGAAGDMTQIHREPSPTAPDTIVETNGLEAWSYTDTNGRIYLKIDGSTDDDFEFELWVETSG